MSKLTVLLAIILSWFAFVQSATAAEAGVTEVMLCPHYEKKDISFSGWESRDTLELHLLGADCTSAVVVLVIRSEKGHPLYWDTWPLWNLAVYNLSEEGEVERTFKKLQDLKVTSSTEMPDLNTECFEDEYCYLGTYTETEKYLDVKAKNLPILCIPVHYENTRCYFYDSDQRVTSILYGYGA